MEPEETFPLAAFDPTAPMLPKINNNNCSSSKKSCQTVRTIDCFKQFHEICEIVIGNVCSHVKIVQKMGLAMTDRSLL